jgi:oxygen-independent coproporphyrinogen-3 oxidase
MKTDMKRLELYIHIPFCVKKCDYCDFLSFPEEGKTQIRYIHALLEEIRFWGDRMGEYTVPTIYIGGGTPSWLAPELIASVMREIFAHFHVETDAEVSIECNPGTVTAAKLDMYKAAGINRLSIGLQSADNEELKILGRIHTYEKFLKTYELARNAGYDNINIDLMSGIPYQTLEKFMRTLQQVLRLKPEHLSVYSLIVEKDTPFYSRYKFDAVKQQAGLRTEILPTEDEVYRIMKATQDILARAGYEQYEISNFAKPGYACRHNIGYWTRENYLGMGLGAASLIENVRYTNTRDLYDYMYQCERLSDKPQEAFSAVEEQTEGAQEAKEEPEATGQAAEAQPLEEEHAMPAGLSGLTELTIPAEFAEAGEQSGAANGWFGCNLHTEADIVSRKAQIEEFMFLGLRMKEGIARADFERDFGVPIEAVYPEIIGKLRKQGLLDMAEGRLTLTDRGMDLANYVMSKFLL